MEWSNLKLQIFDPEDEEITSSKSPSKNKESEMANTFDNRVSDKVSSFKDYICIEWFKVEENIKWLDKRRRRE